MNDYSRNTILIFFGVVALGGIASVLGFGSPMLSGLLIAPIIYWVWSNDTEKCLSATGGET